MSSYIFILCPPYSGSTILWRLLQTSNNVSALPCEGQVIPELRHIMRDDPWNPIKIFPWEHIKTVWNSYWNANKLFFLEKSPPHLIKTQQIIEHFKPIHFLIMVRNPYAHCEGLMRRNNWSPIKSADFAMRCLEQQTLNSENLANSLSFTYEDLTADPKSISQKIVAFLPELESLQYDAKFESNSIDGILTRRIVDLNEKKISRLSNNAISEINSVFKKHQNILAKWGYECISQRSPG